MVEGLSSSSARILNVTTSPSFPYAVFDALLVVIVGEIRTGSLASMVIIFPPLRLLAVPEAARTRLALFPAKSLIVPPFKINAFVPV